jgi:hypothetical protein
MTLHKLSPGNGYTYLTAAAEVGVGITGRSKAELRWLAAGFEDRLQLG